MKRENRATKWKSCIIDRSRGSKSFRLHSKDSGAKPRPHLTNFSQQFGSSHGNYTTDDKNFCWWHRRVREYNSRRLMICRGIFFLRSANHSEPQWRLSEYWSNAATLWWWLLVNILSLVPCGKGEISWQVKIGKKKGFRVATNNYFDYLSVCWLTPCPHLGVRASRSSLKQIFVRLPKCRFPKADLMQACCCFVLWANNNNKPYIGFSVFGLHCEV